MKYSAIVLCLNMALCGCQFAAALTLDVIQFGNTESEAHHEFQSSLSEITEGALQQSARNLLPKNPPETDGGHMSFVLQCDAERQNYVTLKLWGGEYGLQQGRLYLYLEGRQVGHRHLGDVTPFDIGSDEGPALPGRFFYTTLPLPMRHTLGRNEIRVEVRSTGPVYAYGATYSSFQHPLKQASRQIYAAYTHLDPCLMPAIDEPQGQAPETPPLRSSDDGAATIAGLKKQVNHWLGNELRNPRPVSIEMLKFLARAYHVKWTRAYQKPEFISKIVQGIDAAALRHHKDPEQVKREWVAYGPAGDAIRLVHTAFPDGLLDENIADGTVSRRELWTDMLVASRDYRRMNRQHYTNQTMIVDMNIYLANRALQIIAPDKAFAEKQARRYLYEALGLQPWLGNDEPNGGQHQRWGDQHQVFTRKGLSRELGYVGYYGEVQSWALQIWEAVDYDDEQIEKQIHKIAAARSWFRHPGVDAEGYRTMRLESIIGWRDFDYPGRIVYGQETGREGSALGLAARLKDPVNVGYAQQMLEDGQFFSGFDNPALNRGANTRIMMMNAVEEYEAVRQLPPSPHRLPVTAGQPDFCFTDEENGVVALKQGDELLYASLYWRARYGVNYLARIHHLTPLCNRVVTALEEARFKTRGNVYVRPNRVDRDTFDELTPRGEVDQALAGDVLPVAQEPAGLRYHPAQENHYSGRADLYVLRYGDYWIAMNTSSKETYEVQLPKELDTMTDVISGRRIHWRDKQKLAPLTTLVARAHKK